MQPGMPDLQQIVLKAQQMQAEMERAQASLAEAEVTGSAGGGLVTAVATASGELRSIRIDPSVVDRSDIETLEDLVVAAVHDARRAADELASQTMGSVAGGLASSLDLSSLGLGGLSLPGFGGGAVDAAIDPGLTTKTTRTTKTRNWRTPRSTRRSQSTTRTTTTRSSRTRTTTPRTRWTTRTTTAGNPSRLSRRTSRCHQRASRPRRASAGQG